MQARLTDFRELTAREITGFDCIHVVSLISVTNALIWSAGNCFCNISVSCCQRDINSLQTLHYCMYSLAPVYQFMITYNDIYNLVSKFQLITQKLYCLCYCSRLLGFGRLVVFALNEWLQDIKKNQLPSILGGVGPMYSLVQLGKTGSLCAELVWQKINTYRKTSRISRTNSQNLNVSCILLQLSSLNPLKPGVKLRMKM